MENEGKSCADDCERKIIVRSSEFGVRNKIILVALLCGFLLPTSSLAAQNQHIKEKLSELANIQGKFSFVVLGDNRSGDDTYKKLVAMAMERKPVFIVNTGDVIAKPGNVQLWDNFWQLSKAVTVPYFLTVGNHDAHPEVRSSEQTYKEQVDLPGNELYYSFTAGNSLLVVLDSYISGQEKKISGEQYAWLEALLTSSKLKHKFVFLHHPMYTVPGKGRHAGESLDKHPGDRDRLEALFVKNGVKAVFAGHEHFYQRKTVDGINHVITGGAGAPVYALDEFGGFNHYILVTVDGDKVSAEVADMNGKVRDRF